MKKNKKLKNIFADKATLILRKMIHYPGKKWVIRDFINFPGVSIGMAQGVLEVMIKQGYVERINKGPKTYTLLTNKYKLVADWVRKYKFDLNEIYTYYTPDKNILRKLRTYLKNKKYAVTLHTGANLITSFVKTDQVYLYLDTQNWDKDVLELRQKLDLKELVRGGNFNIIRPYYKNSLFFNSRKINGYNVVSNIQLYLDLYNFQPRGREHAEHLEGILKDEGKYLD